MAKKIKGLEIAQKIAKLYCGECVSSAYFNSKRKLKWKCRDNHIWSASLNQIKNSKSWCSKCSGVKKLSLKIAQNVAKKYNGRCLSKKYINSHSYMKWECERGHRWWAKLDSIKNGKHWCKKCYYNSLFLTLNDCRKIAKDNDGQCLSHKYINNCSKLLWKCKNGHKWRACVRDIKNGSWCPKCKIYKTQKHLQKVLEQVLGYRAKPNFKGFDWLKNKNRKFEIDIWFPKLKLAVEYDGKQHFVPVQFGGISYKIAKKRLRNIKFNDELKNKLIRKNKNIIKYFIRFNYKDKIDKECVLKKLKYKGL